MRIFPLRGGGNWKLRWEFVWPTAFAKVVSPTGKSPVVVFQSGCQEFQKHSLSHDRRERQVERRSFPVEDWYEFRFS